VKQNAAVATAIQKEYNLRALPRLTAEWNLNRYIPVTVSNTVPEDDYGYDIEVFPIESIIEPNRPDRGICKAFIGAGRISDAYHKPIAQRFYVADPSDKYKYWVSPNVSDGATNIVNAEPKIIYDRSVKANKISITLENSWWSPDAYTVKTTPDGSTWNTVATNPAIQANGKIELYWNGTGWSSNKPTSPVAPVSMRGVMLSATSMNTTNARLAVIEMSARMELDITDKLIKASDNFDAGDVSNISPVGTITTNGGTVTLWNENNYFSANTSGDLKDLIEPNVVMNLEYIYSIGSQKHTIQQFNLFVSQWDENDDSTVTVTLEDASKFLKEIKPNPAKYENLTLSQILYRLCDAIGYTRYRVFDNVLTNDYKIPVFFTDGESTIWEIFDDLAQASQSVVYFDSYGYLRVKTREDAFYSGAPVDWTLRARRSGDILPDIINIAPTGEYESNTVKVQYKSAEWAKEDNGFTDYTTVWSPDSTLTLRSSPLIASMSATTMEFNLAPSEAAHWPYSGKVVIEGELITYEGKNFQYLDANGQVKTTWLKDQAEYDKLNNLVNSSARYRNRFLGSFKITERGSWNTQIAEHNVEAMGYTGRRFNDWVMVESGAGFSHNRWNSTFNINSNPYAGARDVYMTAVRGSQNSSPWKYMGTRLVFNSDGSAHQSAGVVFNATDFADGYYVEVTPTSSIPEKERASRKSVQLFTRKNNRTNASIPDRGKEVIVVAGVPVDIDIWYNPNDYRVMVWINGIKALHEQIPEGQRLTPSGRMGMFARGKTNVDFEYLYGVARDEWVPDSNYSSFNRILGINEGKSLRDEWLWKRTKKPRRLRKKTKNKYWQKNLQFLDEFGPYVHEMREFEVKFDPSPVQYSKVYSSNDWGASLVDYSSSSFGAKFSLVNTSRNHAVLSGTDSLTFGSTDGVEQHLLVYGRALVFGEQDEVVVKNDQQVRARGEIVTEINSNWIQSKEAAEAVAKWIENHWSQGVDTIEATIFGNPLFEIGDVVSVDMPQKGMSESTHQYFVTGINTDFDQGINTTLTLRRKN
jgi:hypothetical protein